MHFTVLLALSAVALAMPQPMPRAVQGRIARCEAATNCEVYTRSDSTLGIRFKRGMEPGSLDFQQRMRLAKRDDQRNSTQVTLGDTKVEYGCGDDVDPKAILGNLDKVCLSSGSCVADQPFTQPIHFVNPNPGGTAGEGSTQTLTITAEGHYPPDLQRPLIQAIQALAGTGVISNVQKFDTLNKRESGIIALPSPDSAGSCNLVQQTGFFSVDQHTSNSNLTSLVGFIEATVAIPTLQHGFCADIAPALQGGSVAGALPAIGGPAALIFGVVSAICSNDS